MTDPTPQYPDSPYSQPLTEETAPLETFPAPEPAPAPPRVPHLGHTLLFAVLIVVLLLISQAAILGILGLQHPHTDTAALIPRLLDTRLQLASMTLTYLAALGLALAIFPRLWHRSFAQGIQWNHSAAIRLSPRILPAAVLLSLAVQLLQNVIPTPKSAPIETFFTNPTDIILTALFGTLLAPLLEEIFFRGFLLPAFAIAYDWLTLPKTPEAQLTWRTSETLSRPALITATLLSSILFALLHAAQLGYSWASVAVLFAVSLVLTTVRLTTRSVAASTLTHATYNLTIFLSLVIASDGLRHLEKLK